MNLMSTSGTARCCEGFFFFLPQVPVYWQSKSAAKKKQKKNQNNKNNNKKNYRLPNTHFAMISDFQTLGIIQLPT